MIKNLRFLFVALTMILFSGVSAMEVTILPSDTEPIEASDYSVIKGGVAMYVTASTVTDSQFRIFKNQTITFVGLGLNITKVVFTCTAEGDAKYGPGSFGAVEGYTYEGNVGTWTGNAQTVTLIAESNQVRATQIVVTLGEGGSTPDNPDNPDSPGLLSKFEFTSGTITDNGNQTVFDFAGKAAMGDTGEKMDVSGKMIFDFENEICTACKANVTFPSEIIAALAEMDAKANAEKEGFASVERDGATMTVVSSRDFLGYPRILIKSMLRLLIGAETEGLGILGSPMSPSQANVLAGSLNPGEVLDQDVYIKGKIASIKSEFSAQNGIATFFISADGKDEFTFQCDSVYTLENKPWVEGNTQIKVGDEVIICGKVTNYNGTTPETASKKAYIYSLNGVTKNEGGNDNPDSQEVKTVTIAEFNAAAESNDVWYQLTGTIKNLKDGDQYGNFDLEDETGSVYVYGVLSEKGGAKKKFQELVAAKGIKNGDKLTIIGNRGSYNDKIEVVNAYFVSVEAGSDNPDPQPQEVKTVTIAEFNAAPESTDVWYQLTGIVKNLKDGDQYGNVDLEDETGSVYVYGILSEKGGEKKKFQELVAAKGIQNGSKITIIGNRGSYKEKIEVLNAYFVSIEDAAQGQVWDFTKWSDATIANLKADAAASKTSGWSDVEKKADADAGADPTEASKDNCFWLQLEAAPADGALTANGVVIEELKGLLFTEDATAISRNIAIAVNYSVADASKDFGPYAGGSYFWVGGKDRKFTIPNVAAGSTITMEVESHKITDGRGVKLMQDGNQIGDAFTPKTKESHSWTIENTGDVVVANTNGCHIYKIEIAAGAAGIQAVKTATVGNGYIYNLAGQRVDANYKGVVIKNGQKMIQK